MASIQEQRSEETKTGILAAAGKLFASRGYEAVTMREIAKEAGCSHTTIYIYFKDKEALLHQLSMPRLDSLLQRMETLIGADEAPEYNLKAISLAFIEFCLIHRNMYNLILNVKSVRVDEQAPELAINQIRNKLFGKLNGALHACFPEAAAGERRVMFTRIYYYTLHGVVATYANSEETAGQLMDRLEPTFRQTFDVLLDGIRSRMAQSELTRI